MEFVQIKRRVRGKPSSFWWCKHYSAIWSNSRAYSKNVFALILGYRDNVHEFFYEKHSPNVLENQTRLQNSSYTTRKSLIFSVLCALFDLKSRYSKKILPDAELKIVTNSVHLVIWSRGFPTLHNICFRGEMRKIFIWILQLSGGMKSITWTDRGKI